MGAYNVLATYQPKAPAPTGQRHLLVIRYEDRPGHWMGPVQAGTFDFQTFYWNGWGPQHWVIDAGHFEVLHECDPSLSGAQFDRAFLAMFPPQTCEPQRIKAWISPKGEMYPCELVGHEALARDLIIVMGYKDRGMASDILIAHKWQGLYETGQMYYRHATTFYLTVPQRRLVRTLLTLDDNTLWQENLREALADGVPEHTPKPFHGIKLISTATGMRASPTYVKRATAEARAEFVRANTGGWDVTVEAEGSRYAIILTLRVLTPEEDEAMARLRDELARMNPTIG